MGVGLKRGEEAPLYFLLYLSPTHALAHSRTLFFFLPITHNWCQQYSNIIDTSSLNAEQYPHPNPTLWSTDNVLVEQKDFFQIANLIIWFLQCALCIQRWSHTPVKVRFWRCLHLGTAINLRVSISGVAIKSNSTIRNSWELSTSKAITFSALQLQDVTETKEIFFHTQSCLSNW